MSARNVVYLDGSGSVVSFDRRLHIDQHTVQELVEAGVEMRGVNESGSEYTGYIHEKARKRKNRSEGYIHKPTWVSTVVLTNPQGEEAEVTNLAQYAREHFGSVHTSAYIAFIQHGEWKGWKMRRLRVGPIKKGDSDVGG